MKMIPGNDSPGSHGALTLIEHPLSEMESPPSAFPALSHCGGPGARRRPKVFEASPGASVEEGTLTSRSQRTIFIPYA